MHRSNDNRTLSNIAFRETMARKTGHWPPWRRHAVTPPQTGGWLSDMRQCAENGVFTVLSREITAPEFGSVTHAFIVTASGAPDITWAEKQRIKDGVFGRERCAVEVYPRHSELVDEANAYHLWVFAPGYSLPFGIHKGHDRAAP